MITFELHKPRGSTYAAGFFPLDNYAFCIIAGLTEWVMRIIISTQYTDSSLQLTFWADNPMVTTSLGYLYTLGIGNVWASYRDVDKGLPTK